MSLNKTLIVIAGPTAIGKTALAIQLAVHYHTEIISADSRQFYREMNIGTAKPSAAELNTVTHHFINSHSIKDNFSVGDFEEQALPVLHEIFQQKDIAILVGGSGLYIDAVCKGLDTIPKPAPGIREGLNHELLIHGPDQLKAELKKVDPKYYSQVDVENPQRIIRALEVYRSSGTPFSSFRKSEKTIRPFKVIWIGLNTGRDELYNRINLRVDRMLESGLINEVQSLYTDRDLNALKTVGYTELFDQIDGKKDLDEAIELIKQNTRRFAKRQLTWFRKNERIKWFDPRDHDSILHYLEEKLRE